MHDYEDTFFAHTDITFLTLLKPRQRYTNVQSIHFITKFYFAIFEKKRRKEIVFRPGTRFQKSCQSFQTLTRFRHKSCISLPCRENLFQGPGPPVVQTPISTNPGLNFNPGFFFFLSKALSRIIFSIFFRISNHQIVERENSTELAF